MLREEYDKLETGDEVIFIPQGCFGVDTEMVMNYEPGGLYQNSIGSKKFSEECNKRLNNYHKFLNSIWNGKD